MSELPKDILQTADPDTGMSQRTRGILLLGWMAASVLCGFWVATQRVAHALTYHAALPGAWMRGDDFTLYAPWAYWTWSTTLKDEIPHALERGQLGLLVGGLLFVVGVRLLRKKSDAHSIAHGSAKWAGSRELPGMKLLDAQGKERWDGVVLGQTGDGKLLTHDGPEHVLVFAPTRSGKGVGLVVPTLLTWRHSVVVLDIKGENWDLTSGFRSKLTHALRFDPTASDSVRYNPLDEIRLGTKDEIRDIQNLTKIICDPDGTGAATDHWSQSAGTLLMGAILHVLYTEKDKTLSGVLTFLREPTRKSDQTLELMKTTLHLGDRVHPSVAQAAASMLNKADKERAGILSTAEKYLSLYEDPLISRLTSKSDFKIEHLMDGAHPVSLYLVVPPNDMVRLRPLLRLMITQMLGKLTEELTHKNRLLFLLDEFPTLGRMDLLESALAFVAGYGMKCMLIAQTLSQFAKAYGDNNSVMDNCHIKVTFAASDDKTADRVSKMLGVATWKKRQQGESGKKGIFGLDGMSRSEVEFQRALLTPDEIGHLDERRGILMVTGKAPLLFHKVRYYSEQRWTPRLHPAPDENRDLPARCKKCHELLVSKHKAQREAALKTKEAKKQAPEQAANGSAALAAPTKTLPVLSPPVLVEHVADRAPAHDRQGGRGVVGEGRTQDQQVIEANTEEHSEEQAVHHALTLHGEHAVQEGADRSSAEAQGCVLTSHDGEQPTGAHEADEGDATTQAAAAPPATSAPSDLQAAFGAPSWADEDAEDHKEGSPEQEGPEQAAQGPASPYMPALD